MVFVSFFVTFVIFSILCQALKTEKQQQKSLAGFFCLLFVFAKCKFLLVYVTPVTMYVYFFVYMHVKTKDRRFFLDDFCTYIGLYFSKNIANIFASSL